MTGASHGIGRALTEKLISAGANVFLIARSEADLRLLCAKAKQMGSSADYCAIDLRDREKVGTGLPKTKGNTTTVRLLLLQCR